MNNMPVSVHEALKEVGIQVVVKGDMYFGDDYGEHDEYPGRYHGYYMRYKGVHVAAIGIVNGKIHYEGVDRYTDDGEFVMNPIVELGSWNDVLANAIATTTLMRMNGQFETNN